MKSFFHDRVKTWSLRRARRLAEPLMAQALYEDLSAQEEDQLKRLLVRYPLLADEFSELQAFLPRIRLSEDPWQGDLRPALRTAMREGVSPGRGFLLQGRIQYVLVAASLLLGSGLYAFFMLAGDASQEKAFPEEQRVAQHASPLQDELAEAEQLLAQGLAQEADHYLEGAISAHPQDPAQADALLKLADIRYTHLQDYGKAYESYKELEHQHRAVFNRNWDSNKDIRLLSAAFPLNFEPLHLLRAAADADAPLQAYESILSQYPEDIWGEEALRAMTQLVRETELLSSDPATTLQQLALLCTDPVALDRINLEMGHTYNDQLHDRELARDCFNRAATSHHVALADCAREALALLD